ncbi:hypothetical protein [Amycolatopsis antarctica]|uniref:hypothetical protein n=1 Tax=Amycolatopsis antarctica TaxID=1854586 RepID=UPI0013FDE0DA|nr:hypothetical protein [Amycolatopsis antarctica]
MSEADSPCLLHRAVHPSGVTWTTIRRAQTGQNRGGSSSVRFPAQRGCATVVFCPQWTQNSAAGSPGLPDSSFTCAPV